MTWAHLLISLEKRGLMNNNVNRFNKLPVGDLNSYWFSYFFFFEGFGPNLAIGLTIPYFYRVDL